MLIFQDLREHLHVQLCNKRRPLSQLKADFPTFDYSQVWTEEDWLFKHSPNPRETDAELVVRSGRALRQILKLAGDATFESFS